MSIEALRNLLSNAHENSKRFPDERVAQDSILELEHEHGRRQI